jgi:phage shock protein PspC (stress-responsive transcriptional regulator)
MQKVVNISLNGNSYQLEEPGYEQLRAYLERAEARLTGSPDRAEVMSDLEQAIGEKCRGHLGPHKSVVSSDEVARIIADMGPVEAADEKPAGEPGAAAAATPSAGAQPPRKRLFKIREGSMWGGVCNGLAAYMGLDVTWVRIATVVLTLFTGVTLIVYLVMLVIVPYADTAEDRAAAFGVPFNTEDILGRAKKNFEENNQRWHAEWRRQQRHWNRQFRHMNETLRSSTANMTSNVTANMGPVAKGALAVFLPIAAIVGAGIFVVWILSLISLVTQHSILGWSLPHNVPLWVGILGLVLLYMLVSAPFKMVRDAGAGQGYHAGWRAFHNVVFLCVVVLLFWVAYTFIPGISEIVDSLLWAANLTMTTFSETVFSGSWI